MCIRKIVLLALALLCLGAFALAEREVEACEPVLIRTGPGEDYDVVCVLEEGTSMLAYGYEANGDTLWDMVEFELDGEPCRGYTSDALAFASASGYPELRYPGQKAWCFGIDDVIYAAPAPDAMIRGYLSADDVVTLLENADSGELDYGDHWVYRGYAHVEDDDTALLYGTDFVYIEYEDYGMLNRGYIVYPYDEGGE